MKILPHLTFTITLWSADNIHTTASFSADSKTEAVSKTASCCMASHWPNQDQNSDVLLPYAFLSVFWEFAILIAKQEMSHKENLFPNLNSWCIHKKLLTFQSNGNTDCVIF